jgi:hypothetical protein
VSAAPVPKHPVNVAAAAMRTDPAADFPSAHYIRQFVRALRYAIVDGLDSPR